MNDALRSRPVAGTLAAMGLTFALLTAAFLLASGCNGNTHGFRGQPSAKDAKVILEKEELLRSRLKVPESARFADVFVSTTGGAQEVCGHIDALNSFGAMTGNQRFIMGDAENLLESDFGAAEMDRQWRRYCERGTP